MALAERRGGEGGREGKSQRGRRAGKAALNAYYLPTHKKAKHTGVFLWTNAGAEGNNILTKKLDVLISKLRLYVLHKVTVGLFITSEGWTKKDMARLSLHPVSEEQVIPLNKF